jgi:hypothetical protein
MTDVVEPKELQVTLKMIRAAGAALYDALQDEDHERFISPGGTEFLAELALRAAFLDCPDK